MQRVSPLKAQIVNLNDKDVGSVFGRELFFMIRCDVFFLMNYRSRDSQNKKRYPSNIHGAKEYISFSKF